MAVTTSNLLNTPETSDGFQVGSSATTSKVGFFAATPVVQPTATAQSAVPASITDASGGTGAATNGILTLTGTYNSAIIANGIATVAAQVNSISTLVNRLRTDLVALGLIKGS